MNSFSSRAGTIAVSLHKIRTLNLMAIPEHNISGKPWKWWSSYLRPLVHHKWGKRYLSEREKFTVLLEAAAALIYTAASCSAVLLQRWLLGLPQLTRRCTKQYMG